jgi:hypothetical protein
MEPHALIARTKIHLDYGCWLRYHKTGQKVPRRSSIQINRKCSNASSQELQIFMKARSVPG